jgi:hypothetical protein
VEIATRVDVLNDKAFGEVGPYEKLRGKAYFAVDPTNPRNQDIADIELAPRNAEGKVEFSADLFILKPKDPARGNGLVFFDVINRGNFRLLSTFSGGAPAGDPTSEAHFGNASLLNEGYTLVAVGWQFDVADELIGLQAWDKGRMGALLHTSIDGTRDLQDAPKVRNYYSAGSRHGSGTVPAGDGGGQFPNNTLAYTWAERGLMAALDAWARLDVEPPPSAHPRLADGTMIPHHELRFPAVPGVQWPTHVPGGYRVDVETSLSPLPFLLSQLDEDGNELGGIRLPEQRVPLATMTGWQFRSERLGAPTP